jgi:hypothetical protein
MKALTLRYPWAWAIAFAGKDVENRTWKPPASAFGTRIAIHAGRTADEWDFDACGTACREAGFDPPTDWPRGVIICTTVLAGWVEASEYAGIDEATAERSRNSAWFSGTVGWVLRDVQVLRTPIPRKGALGLWTLPDDALLA